MSYQIWWVHNLLTAGVISLSVWLCHALEHQMLFYTKSLLFCFINKDLEARFCSENLLAQTGKERHPTGAPSLWTCWKESSLLSSQTKLLKVNVPSFFQARMNSIHFAPVCKSNIPQDLQSQYQKKSQSNYKQPGNFHCIEERFPRAGRVNRN